ncbi:MAG TPA: DUF2993 domain-containing protein [Streptomyces sp.]|uniref:LmeA family phospholipid-binding protein n=1 Tax=Streptomyces sp. TaxID=1931 RepID=UPI002D37810B|nr:DUF2993 domain-containing protein [Streptomyces sp.]HZG02721.1 DUF2993 domain-containing protein [Streptomyces sp.]
MRALRTLLIFLVILGGLFVGADRLAVNLAEDEAASRIKSARGLSEQPSVEVHGFPFLTQVLGKELESVDATLDGLTVQVGGQEIDVTEVDVNLRDVRLENNFSSAVADRATGSARISYQDLTEVGRKGAVIGYAGPERAARNQVKLEAKVPLLDLTLYSTVGVRDGDTISVRADELPDVPVAEDVVRGQIDRNLEVTGLPQGLRLEKVDVDDKGVVLHLRGEDVALIG